MNIILHGKLKMIKREFEKLFNEAVEYAHKNQLSMDDAINKFGDSLVLKCVSICRENKFSGFDFEYNNGTQTCASLIEKYFGVNK